MSTPGRRDLRAAGRRARPAAHDAADPRAHRAPDAAAHPRGAPASRSGRSAALESRGEGRATSCSTRCASLAGRTTFRVLVLGHVDADVARRRRERARSLELARPFAARASSTPSSTRSTSASCRRSGRRPTATPAIEFLAKGIPVIANAIGGMADYMREGETGWLNRSLLRRGARARSWAGSSSDPSRSRELNERLLAERDAIVKPIARHADEMDAIYREVSRLSAAPREHGHVLRALALDALDVEAALLARRRAGRRSPPRSPTTPVVVAGRRSAAP